MFFVRLNAPLIDLIVNIVLLIWCPSFQDSDKRKSGAAGGSGSSSDAKKKRSDDDRPKDIELDMSPANTNKTGVEAKDIEIVNPGKTKRVPTPGKAAALWRKAGDGRKNKDKNKANTLKNLQLLQQSQRLP